VPSDGFGRTKIAMVGQSLGFPPCEVQIVCRQKLQYSLGCGAFR